MTRLVSLLCLSACVHISDDELAWRTGTSSAPDSCTEQTWYVDADGDGYGDPTAAVQGCDQPAGTVDNYDDCDDTDPDATLLQGWHLDGDGDGYGTDETTQACGQPAGYADQAGDCDDADADVNPGANENCDTAYDDNCDAVLNQVNADGCTLFYEDSDGDGYGSASFQCSCDSIEPFTSSTSDDCDDGNADVSPGADEVCYDGVDNDCDGTANDCGLSEDVDLSDAQGVILGQATDDQLGFSVAYAGDVNGDGAEDVIVGANLGGDSSEGLTYVLHGPLSGDISLDSHGAMLTGDTAAQAGWDVSEAGDYDGDGYDDVLVGAIYQGDDRQGSAWLVWGPVSDAALAAVGVELAGTAVDDRAGCAVVGLADFDGTGDPGLAVGAYHVEADGEGVNGAVYILDDGLSASGSLTALAVATLTGSKGDRAGFSLDSGDFDGDGVSDILVGADRSDIGASNGGAVHIVLGPVTNDLQLENADGTWYGEIAFESVGLSSAVAGDLDGDGLDDIIAGAPGYSSYAGSGSAYIVLGPATGTHSVEAGVAAFTGSSVGDGVGRSVAAAGDFNYDGDNDVIIGGYLAGNGGQACLVYGPLEGGIDPGSGGVVILSGSTNGDQAGIAVAGGRDIGGDGMSDVLVGAVDADGSASDSGVVHMLFGGGL